MKASILPLVAFLAAACLSLANCTSPIETRIAQNPQIYNGLSEHQKQLVARGEVERGMSKGAVYLAWGDPPRTSTAPAGKAALESWSYEGYVPVYGGAHLTYDDGAGRKGDTLTSPLLCGEYTGNYVPHEVRRGDFVDDKLTAWKQTW